MSAAATATAPSYTTPVKAPAPNAAGAHTPEQTRSAVKIQSAFRGKLERSAVKLEKQLARLPVTSPAKATLFVDPTPSATGAAAASQLPAPPSTPVSTGSVATPSPLAALSSTAGSTPVAPVAASLAAAAQESVMMPPSTPGVHTGSLIPCTPPSQPSLKKIRVTTTTADGKITTSAIPAPVSAVGVTPSTTRVASVPGTAPKSALKSALKQPSKIDVHGMLNGSGGSMMPPPTARTPSTTLKSVSATGPQSTIKLSINTAAAANSKMQDTKTPTNATGAAGKAVPSTAAAAPADMKSISKDLKEQRRILKDIVSNWTLRVKALNRYEELITSQPAQVWSNWSGLRDELDSLRPCIEAQLNDLRSSIVREACRCLISLAGHLPGRSFDDSLAVYIPILCSKLYVTVKAISAPCDSCITELIARKHTTKVLEPVRINPRFLHHISV